MPRYARKPKQVRNSAHMVPISSARPRTSRRIPSRTTDNQITLGAYPWYYMYTPKKKKHNKTKTRRVKKNTTERNAMKNNRKQKPTRKKANLKD